MARQKRSVFNEINITPLTDIFLVLLIIMMVIAPLLDRQGLSLIVPENVEDTTKLKETKILTVTVDDDDEFFIGEEPVDESALLETIKSKRAEYPDGLLIETSENSTHGAMVKVMDCAEAAGIKSVSASGV